MAQSHSPVALIPRRQSPVKDRGEIQRGQAPPRMQSREHKPLRGLCGRTPIPLRVNTDTKGNNMPTSWRLGWMNIKSVHSQVIKILVFVLCQWTSIATTPQGARKQATHRRMEWCLPTYPNRCPSCFSRSSSLLHPDACEPRGDIQKYITTTGRNRYIPRTREVWRSHHLKL